MERSGRDVVSKRWDEMYEELCNLDTRGWSHDTAGAMEKGLLKDTKV
jgi:hypothetical protein